MRSQLLLTGMALAGATLMAGDASEWRTAQLEDVEIKARLIRDRNEMVKRLGSDLEREYIVVEMELRPLYNSELRLSRDDFLLRSYRDNDRSTAQSPEQIAGGAVLVLGEGRMSRGGGIFSESQDPILVGGVPGTGMRPRSLGNPNNIGVGSGGASAGSVEVTEASRATTTLLDRLTAVELPIAETRVPVHGYLYFQVNPKQKPKNLVLSYDGNAGECKIRFK